MSPHPFSENIEFQFHSMRPHGAMEKKHQMDAGAEPLPRHHEGEARGPTCEGSNPSPTTTCGEACGALPGASWEGAFVLNDSV